MEAKMFKKIVQNAGQQKQLNLVKETNNNVIIVKIVGIDFSLEKNN